MWMKILILVAIVAAVIYGFRALGSNRARRDVDRRPEGSAPARDGAVDLIRCVSCGAYTPEGKHCTSCGNRSGG